MKEVREVMNDNKNNIAQTFTEHPTTKDIGTKQWAAFVMPLQPVLQGFDNINTRDLFQTLDRSAVEMTPSPNTKDKLLSAAHVTTP